MGEAREARPRKRGDVRLPQRLTAGPHLAGQPHVAREARGPRLALEFRELEVRLVPHFDATEHVATGIEDPKCAPLPIQALADGLEHAAASLGERRGLGERAGDRILCRAASLDLLALADVAHERAEQPRVLDANGCDGQLERDLVAIAVSAGYLDPPVEDRPLAGRQEAPQSVEVRLVVARRDNRGLEGLPDHVTGRPPKHSLRLRAPATDRALSVHGDNGVERRVDDRFPPELGRAELGEGAAPLNRHRDLSGDEL